MGYNNNKHFGDNTSLEDKPENRFVNPYNFVSLGNKKDSSPYEEGDFTGCLDIKITTKTPLILLDTERVSIDNEHATYDFYSYHESKETGKSSPVIPGSSIRGCVRAIHEAMNNSCFGADPATRFYRRRTSFKEGTPGLLTYDKELGKWILSEAERYKVPNFNFRNDKLINCQTHQEFSNFDFVEFEKKQSKNVVKAVNISKIATNSSSSNSGYIFHTEDHPNLKNGDCPIYIFATKKDQNGNRKRFALDDNEMQMFADVLKRYKDEKINQLYKNKKHHGYSHIDLDEAKEKGYNIPVYYRKEGSRIFLSPAMKGVEAIYNNLATFIEGYESCESENECCPTCQIFGSIPLNNAKEKGITSRIRFSDATTTASVNECYDKAITLKPLLGPHVSNVEFYTVFPAVLPENLPKHTYDDYGTRIRGRKFYWHHKPDYQYCSTKEKNNLNSTVLPVKTGIEFNCKVYYEKLTEEQLKRLIASINLDVFGDNKLHCHMIGHAKPYGFGSIKMEVVKNTRRIVTLHRDHVFYEEVNLPVESFDYKNKEQIQQLGWITDFHAADGYHVIYPITQDSEEGFKWFANNQGSVSNECFKQILPTIDEIIKEEKKIYLLKNKSASHKH